MMESLAVEEGGDWAGSAGGERVYEVFNLAMGLIIWVGEREERRDVGSEREERGKGKDLVDCRGISISILQAKSKVNQIRSAFRSTVDGE